MNYAHRTAEARGLVYLVDHRSFRRRTIKAVSHTTSFRGNDGTFPSFLSAWRLAALRSASVSASQFVRFAHRRSRAVCLSHVRCLRIQTPRRPEIRMKVVPQNPRFQPFSIGDLPEIDAGDDGGAGGDRRRRRRETILGTLRRDHPQQKPPNLLPARGQSVLGLVRRSSARRLGRNRAAARRGLSRRSEKTLRNRR